MLFKIRLFFARHGTGKVVHRRRLGPHSYQVIEVWYIFRVRVYQRVVNVLEGW
jgi:hypothetical protein